MGQAVCHKFAEKLPALERWLEHTRRLASEYHLTVDRSYILPVVLYQIRVDGQTVYWDWRDPLPLGAVVLDEPRAGYLAILVAVD